jgi:AraC-like DNA-binding protein
MGDVRGREMEAFLLPIHYVRHIADQVRGLGADTSEWLMRSGLRPDSLDDPDLVLGFSTFERLVREAIELTREPALGLFVGERLLASSHGILGYAATSSPTLEQAIFVLERFTGLRTSLIAVSHCLVGRHVRVQFGGTRPLGDVERPLLEAVVLSIKNVLDSISSGACAVSEVSFSFGTPDYAPLARALFRCDVKYGRTWSGFALPAHVILLPLKTADPEAFRQAALICQRELDKLTSDESLAARVRRSLLESQNGFPSLEVVARQLHLVPRTLHRRLVEEGTSYRELLEDVRHSLAIEHVKSGRFTFEQIAYTLGYSDLANFRRAFKRWESVAPSEYASRRRSRSRRNAPSTLVDSWRRPHNLHRARERSLGCVTATPTDQSRQRHRAAERPRRPRSKSRPAVGPGSSASARTSTCPRCSAESWGPRCP